MKRAIAVLALLCTLGAGTSSFNEAGAQAASTLLRTFYAGKGLWRDCAAPGCHAYNQDWGVDSLTYTLYLRWRTTHDRALIPYARALLKTAPSYPAPCTSLPCVSWSDVPEWDAIAAIRDYQMTGDSEALKKARAAFAFVDGASVFALGACPDIHYQLPGGKTGLKTLETDANYVKAALLLYRVTRDASYIEKARAHYAAIRRRFLDPKASLYTVYVFDDAKACTQVGRRFFASVNGDMIWSGLELARATGDTAYREQAKATASAVEADLRDGRGIFADLQAENDIVEPLVEAMYGLATRERNGEARAWILRNARVALGARKADGTFGRFFDGPPPQAMTTVWQSNGGLALEIAASALAPNESVETSSAWAGAKRFTQRIGLRDTITFDGSGIALIGTIGATCCEPGHARVFVDGRETFDETGIWQNKSSSGRSIPNSVLFAWRWKSAGRHTLRFLPGTTNAKEGGGFLDASGYLVIP